jgi:carbamoyltransferase
MVLYLGYSGIHGSSRYQFSKYGDINPRLARFAQGQDSAAALVSDTTVIAAAAEERFTGEKATGDFPVNAIRYCLDEAQVKIADVDRIQHAFDYRISPAVAEADPELAQRYHTMYSALAQGELVRKHFGTSIRLPEVVGVRHHLAHAHSAFDLSGFDRAVVLVSDGMGEDVSLTIFEATAGRYQRLASVPASHSMGILYALVTCHLGFAPGMDEYKVMALAALGDPDRFSGQFSELVHFQEDGLYLIPFLAREVGRRAQDLHEAACDKLSQLFGPARGHDDDLTQQHLDLAAALQSTLNQATLWVAKQACQLSTAEDVCLAGGVALNCVANSQLAESGLFGRIFVQPAAGDDGSALGAALAGATEGIGWRGGGIEQPYWGPGWSDEELQEVAYSEAYPGAVDILGESLLAETAADDIAAGWVIGWFQGRMEFGPRALGNRSILADPRTSETRDRVNRAIKNREAFRPLAPAVAAEEASRYFEIEAGRVDQYQHMLFVAKIRPEFRPKLSAVVHDDGTARLQAVRRQQNERFHGVLRALAKRIGMPIVLNTSLNVQGQPIVRTPHEAIATARQAGLDCVYLGSARLQLR